MKYLIKPIILVLLIGLFTQPDLLAQNLDKYIVKGEDKYQDGDYKKAAKQFSKLKSKSISKLGSPNKYLAIAFMKEAKINYALGQLFTFQNFINNSLATSKKVNQEASGDHALLLLEATDLMIAYGNFRKAEDYLNQAREVLEKSNNLTDDFKADIDLKQATVLSGKGYYTQAVNLIDKQNEYFSGRAVSKETFVDKTTGKIKTVKLDEQERLRRYRDYAYLMTLKAQSYNKQGTDIHIESNIGESWLQK